jgi:hypothetical protein
MMSIGTPMHAPMRMMVPALAAISGWKSAIRIDEDQVPGIFTTQM